MHWKFLASFILALALVLSLQVKSANAILTPIFPHCSSPQGTLKVQYNDGIHGIPGDTSKHHGSDAVYSVTDHSLIQCFCPENGVGIQTNWWKIDGLSQAEIDAYKRSGWTYVPNGALWGLDPVPYLTINTEYICGGVGGGDVLGAMTGPDFEFAATGNKSSIYSLSLLGLGLIISGFSIKRKITKIVRG